MHAIHTCLKKARSLTLSKSNDDCNKQRRSDINKGLGQEQTEMSSHNLDLLLTVLLYETWGLGVKPNDSFHMIFFS